MPPSPRQSRSRKRADAAANADPFATSSDLRLPDADQLFRPVRISLSDIDSARNSTVLQAVVRNIHVRQYELRGNAVRAADMEELAKVRGGVQELDRVLSYINDCLSGNVDDNPHANLSSDANGEEFEEMTIATDA